MPFLWVGWVGLEWIGLVIGWEAAGHERRFFFSSKVGNGHGTIVRGCADRLNSSGRPSLDPMSSSIGVSLSRVLWIARQPKCAVRWPFSAWSKHKRAVRTKKEETRNGCRLRGVKRPFEEGVLKPTRAGKINDTVQKADDSKQNTHEEQAIEPLVEVHPFCLCQL